jgi:peptidyl-tRNA hydrolase
VRIGVGRPKSFQESTSGSEVGTQAPPPVLADWVLGEFGKQERDGVAAATARAVDATFELIKNGLERAQYRFNK